MPYSKRNILTRVLAALAVAALVSTSAAHELEVTGKKRGAKRPATPLVVQSWMSPEVGAAWRAGYRGKRATITVIDDFTSRQRFYGNLGQGTQLLRHGEWTRQEAKLIAPQASIRSKDFNSGTAVGLARGLNVLNLSYGMFAAAGYSNAQIGWSRQEASIISYARTGRAIVSKAAGNDAVAVGGTTASGYQDYLASALIGTKTTIFAGALNSNGTTDRPASLASYSNFAGPDAQVQRQFLVVGVEGNKTGLYGTSFAAPIVSGYSAILGSKFTRATPTQITNQLLNTARKDTLLNYDPAVYGQGEASLTRALAPRSIR
jgi:subtilisin family serine protease